MTDDETEKWIQARKRNFPTSKRVEEVKINGKIKEEKGILSKLEIKLREKIKILSKIDKKGYNRVDNNRNRNNRGNNYNNFKNNSENINNNKNRRRRRTRNKHRNNNNFDNKNTKELNLFDNNNLSNSDNIGNIVPPDDDIEDGEIKEENHKITKNILNETNYDKLNTNNNNKNNFFRYNNNINNNLDSNKNKNENLNKEEREKNEFSIMKNNNIFDKLRHFRYRKNYLYDDMIKQEKIKELNIILQAFRYFVNENLV